MEELWAIVSIEDENLFWNDKLGWVRDDAGEMMFDLFTLEEKDTLKLPLDGMWFKF